MPAGLEIERKYLLSSAPLDDELAQLGATPHLIEQVYLRSEDGWVRRVRKVEVAGGTRYVATRKREVVGIVREEHEQELDAAAYDRCLTEADPARRAIRKVRHVFPFAGHVMELDVFSEPPGLVLLEIELEDAADEPELPPTLRDRLVREVSLESAYMNYEIALLPIGGAGPGALDGGRPGAAPSAP
jgi:CYTH domain-containing protein